MVLPEPIPKTRKPTLKTIAAVTGLTTATVSRALNDSGDISQATKLRVRAAAEEVGYQLDRAGLRLRTGRSKSIALVLNMEDEILGVVSPLVAGVAEVLDAAGYSLMIAPETPQQDPLEAVEEVLRSNTADGIILTRSQPFDHRVALLTALQVPFVTYGRTRMDVEHAFVDYDNDRYAFQAVSKLVALKRRRLALLAPPGHLTFHFHMVEGFRRGISEFGCEEIVLDTVDLDTPLQVVFAAGYAHARSESRADGIVAGSASTAVAFLAGMEAGGMTIRSDFDMVAKEPARFTEWLRPEVIAINEDIKGHGNALASSILMLLKPSEEPVPRILLSSLEGEASLVENRTG